MASSDALISVPVTGGSPASLLMKDVSNAQDKSKLAHAHAPIDKNGAHVNPASEDTLAALKTATDAVKTAIDQLKAAGATEVTLAAVKTAVQGGATLVGQNAIFDALVFIEGELTAEKASVDAVKTAVDQFKAIAATEVTLAAVKTALTAPLTVVGKSSHVSAAPAVTAQSYAAGKCIGGVFPFTAALREAGKSALLQSASLRLKGANANAVDLVIFRATPTVTTGLVDGATFAVDVADFDKVSKVVSFTVWNSLGTPSLSNVDGIGKLLGNVDPAAVDVRAILVARGAVTIGSVSDVSVGLGLLLD